MEKITEFKSKWSENIELAKELYQGRFNAQMRIAELALEVCDITWGGASEEIRRGFTLTKFSKQTGISVKSLSHWISVKKQVYDKLDTELKSKVSFTNMATVTRFVNRETPATVVQQKTRDILGTSGYDAKLLRYAKGLRAVAHNFETKDAAGRCKIETIEEIYFYCTMIRNNIKRLYKDIKPKCHGLTGKYSVNSFPSANISIGNEGPGKRSSSAGWYKDEDGFSIKITDKDLKILKYMNKEKNKFHSPTDLGVKLGGHNKSSASAWSGRSLNKLMSVGIVERRQDGKYKATNKSDAFCS